jgi:hypothetical protein
VLIHLEIDDGDLAYLQENMRFSRFTLNRYDDVAGKRVSRLLYLQLIEQLEYYGEQLCYHPSYKLTGLGERVMGLAADSADLISLREPSVADFEAWLAKEDGENDRAIVEHGREAADLRRKSELSLVRQTVERYKQQLKKGTADVGTK